MFINFLHDKLTYKEIYAIINIIKIIVMLFIKKKVNKIYTY